MADTDFDLIACLYPCSDKHAHHAQEAIELHANRARRVGELEQPQMQSDRRGRGSTEEPEPRGGDAKDENRKRLELRFSDGPKSPLGLVFGCDQDCDIVLPRFSGVSSYHFALTFDDHDRLIVKDLGSLIGTQVTYSNDGAGWRRDFVWIVGRNSVPNRRTSIVIHVNRYLKFQLVVSNQDINSPLYKENTERFRQGTGDVANLVGQLKFTADTERATETHTPGRGPIFLERKLGEGGFGVVTHFWNVSTADEYALKQPSARALREKEFDATSWKREASIMGRINHEHIVRLLRAEEEPWPKLYLEYLPGGSLRDQEHISTKECAQVLRQLLSALDYLHRLEPPIVHRDIKPDNILVQSRYGGNIVVKFGDFGISRERRESGYWKTICGTWKYVAPEILEIKELRNIGEQSKRRYTTAVDIWSLGVVMFRLLRGLPRYETGYEREGAMWSEMILTKLKDDLIERPNELLQFLSTKMLVMAPEARGDAQECHDIVLSLPKMPDVARQMLQPVPFVEEQRATVHGGDAQTAIFRGIEAPPGLDYKESGSINTADIMKYIITSGDSVDSAEIQRRHARSKNPPPSSQQRRSGRVTKSPPAVHSRHVRHNQSAAEPRPQASGDELTSGIGHRYKDPSSSNDLGSSLSALERAIPLSWNQSSPRNLSSNVTGSEPNYVAGGIGYVEDEYLANEGQHNVAQPPPPLRRSWGAGGRSWGPAGRSWDVEKLSSDSKLEEDADPDAEEYNDEVIAARLLLAIQRDSNDRVV